MDKILIIAGIILDCACLALIVKTLIIKFGKKD
jgi:hypothetical protein